LDLKLEVVVPVSDVDRAKVFYAEMLGFNVDHDTTVTDEHRLIQADPSRVGLLDRHRDGWTFGGIVDMPPGFLRGLQLVVSDIHAARADLVERGVGVSEVQGVRRGLVTPEP
jgi:catechol 2,3-dioxygenase-like lactoylglutathione lyase family enzyme